MLLLKLPREVNAPHPTAEKDKIPKCSGRSFQLAGDAVALCLQTANTPVRRGVQGAGSSRLCPKGGTWSRCPQQEGPSHSSPPPSPSQQSCAFRHRGVIKAGGEGTCELHHGAAPTPAYGPGWQRGPSALRVLGNTN